MSANIFSKILMMDRSTGPTLQKFFPVETQGKKKPLSEVSASDSGPTIFIFILRKYVQ